MSDTARIAVYTGFFKCFFLGENAGAEAETAYSAGFLIEHRSHLKLAFADPYPVADFDVQIFEQYLRNHRAFIFEQRKIEQLAVCQDKTTYKREWLVDAFQLDHPHAFVNTIDRPGHCR